jgi:hypothetical protein
MKRERFVRLCTTYYAIKIYWIGVELQLHRFLTLPLDGGTSYASHSSCSLDTKTESWVDPITSFDVVLWRKIPGPAKMQTTAVHPVTSLLTDLCSATFYIQKYKF